jgi:alpha-beta hydrolase superfamily lysophospholipase
MASPDGALRDAATLADRSVLAEGEGAAEYRAHYGFDRPGLGYRLVTIDAGGARVAVHLVEGRGQRRGTVYFAHGYLSHSGLIFPELEFLLDEGWSLALIDLPGHGLSDGSLGDIEDFSSYGTALSALMSELVPSLPRPAVAMGHSTGCAAWIEYLSGDHPGPRPDRVLFLAPLVRVKPWPLVLFGYAVSGRFIARLPVRLGDPPHDVSARRRILEDPFRPRRSPSRWAGALIAWTARLQGRSFSDFPPLVVVQGDSDRTLDFDWNLAFLRGKVTGADIRMVEGIGHFILCDRADRLGEIEALVLASIR